MRRLAKVATPATAAAVVVPVSRAFFPALASAPSATRIAPLQLVAMLPSESYAVTRTGGLRALSCVAAAGCTVKASVVGGPGATVNVSLIAAGSAPALAVSA